MNYQDEFRQKELVQGLAGRIRRLVSGVGRPLTFMEVCGTHTMAIYRFGLRSLLPPEIRLISGPGCPVCVTPNDYLDRAIAICRLPEVITVTFGDMMRVPGSTSSLLEERAKGADIRIVYSPLDAVAIRRTVPQAYSLPAAPAGGCHGGGDRARGERAREGRRPAGSSWGWRGGWPWSRGPNRGPG